MTRADESSAAASSASAQGSQASSESTSQPSASVQSSVPRVQLPGANLLRALGVLAVIYSHISYYFIDGLGQGWWLIDVVYRVLIRGVGLNQHLSFFGVSFFMVLTGALVTGSAMRHRPGIFLFNRIGRLVPLLWVAIAIAIVLVRCGVNGMFSGGPGITWGQAAWSFVLGGFFHKPEFAVLGVTWTLVVQIFFYLYCVATRSLLRIKPAVVPIIGAALCAGVVVYDHFLPTATLIIVGKVAATLPCAFLGQVLYLAWTRLASWTWVIAGLLAQLAVVQLAVDLHGYWGGVTDYLWTVMVVVICVVLLGRRDSRLARSRIVTWLGTRSYPIYLLHTLILYRCYSLVSGSLGKTGAILTFLVVAFVAAEIAYRWVELPAGRWISRRVAARLRE